MAKRLPEKTLNDWNEVDLEVRRLGELQRQVRQAKICAEEKIDLIKEEKKNRTDTLKAQIKLHTNRIKKFVKKNKREFKNKRSKFLNFGVVGFRRSSKISVTTKDNATINQIRNVFKSKAGQFLKITEKVDKDALAKLTDQQLESIAAKRKTKDQFFIEPLKDKETDV